MKTIFILFAALLITASFAFAGDSTEVKGKVDSTEVKKAPAEKKIADLEMKITKSGVKYYDIKEGSGKVCVLGTQVECHYTLWFADDKGEKKTPHFQSSKDGDNTFLCTLGRGLITGWSEGMVGMKEGGTRLLIIPPELGYGKGGRGIPPNQTLIFEIDFIKFIK